MSRKDIKPFPLHSREIKAEQTSAAAAAAILSAGWEANAAKVAKLKALRLERDAQSPSAHGKPKNATKS